MKCPNCGDTMKCDRSATGKAAKVHGSGFEHIVAKRISTGTGYKFKKTPASGGMHLEGDIFCIDFLDMPFVIECKNKDDLTVGKIVKRPEILLTADDGDPLATKGKVGVINNGGQAIAIIHAEDLVLEGWKGNDGTMPLTTFELDDGLYFMADLSIIFPAIIAYSHKPGRVKIPQSLIGESDHA